MWTLSFGVCYGEGKRSSHSFSEMPQGHTSLQLSLLKVELVNGLTARVGSVSSVCQERGEPDTSKHLKVPATL